MTLDPGATVDLRVRRDASATGPAHPREVPADRTVVAPVASPTCGDLGFDASLRAAS